MRVRDGQTFLSIYYEPGAVEIATGESDPHVGAESWKRETKTLGQVATPAPVAALMARWVMSKNPRTVLDPAAGLGGLLHECRRIGGSVKMVGVERDAETLSRAKSTAPKGTKLILADYLMADSGKFAGIISNPPYVKAQRMDMPESKWRYLEELFGTPLDRLTNLYALFLLKIWEDLAPGGRAAVLIPAEFLNANFGEEIKERLLVAIRPAGLIVFDPAVNLFDDALTTSAILFLEKKRPIGAPQLAAVAKTVADAEKFVSGLLAGKSTRSKRYLDMSELHPREKWVNRLLSSGGGDATSFRHVVGDYFKCRRGIATGANDYFCLSKGELLEHGLDLDHVDACLTKATDATGLVFTKEKFSRLVKADRRCYLLNPRQNGQELDRYLKRGKELEIPERHLPSHRPVWYLPENRAVAAIWAAVFSRESVKFILNTSGAKNLTCFHGLYANPGNENLAPLLTLFLNSSWGRASFGKVNRFYGDGLNKLEPKDVEAMPCPEFPSQTAVQAAEVNRTLREFESLPEPARQEKIDKMAASLLRLEEAR
jgi:adenine-specific DNA-methyltransferase